MPERVLDTLMSKGMEWGTSKSRGSTFPPLSLFSQELEEGAGEFVSQSRVRAPGSGGRVGSRWGVAGWEPQGSIVKVGVAQVCGYRVRALWFTLSSLSFLVVLKGMLGTPELSPISAQRTAV